VQFVAILLLGIGLHGISNLLELKKGCTARCIPFFV
jgi:hypothetical protein